MDAALLIPVTVIVFEVMIVFLATSYRSSKLNGSGVVSLEVPLDCVVTLNEFDTPPIERIAEVVAL
ncbi:hypothetical protein JCM14469_30320 [Desulfatiferula olefinivorans]